ncbi:hypothetical protein K523DRAFT_323294 [Schizophyllum commune Tattone D]|nr:hypothetical protein K523DRAFT_323294 [Schizophyllum commune Tattone D]
MQLLVHVQDEIATRARRGRDRYIVESPTRWKCEYVDNGKPANRGVRKREADWQKGPYCPRPRPLGPPRMI